MAKIIDAIKNNKKDILVPVCVLLVICIIIPLALSLTNKVTVDKIAALQEKNEQATMARLIKADKFENGTYSSGDSQEFSYYTAKNGSEICGYVFVTSAKGYGGDVSVMTAVDTDGKIKSVAILDVSSETPGLGQNAGKESFYTQYEGKKSSISLVKSGADADRNEIDAVTGATITSKAVTKAVNKALENFKSVKNIAEKSSSAVKNKESSSALDTSESTISSETDSADISSQDIASSTVSQEITGEVQGNEE